MNHSFELIELKSSDGYVVLDDLFLSLLSRGNEHGIVGHQMEGRLKDPLFSVLKSLVVGFVLLHLFLQPRSVILAEHYQIVPFQVEAIDGVGTLGILGHRR